MATLLNKVKNAIFKESLPKTAIINLDEAASKYLNSSGKWRTVQFVVNADWKDVRLDRLLTNKFDISASLAQKLIRTKKVWIERATTKIVALSNLRVLAGDSVNLSEIFLPERKEWLGPLSSADEAFLKEWTLFEDDRMIVLNKPSGMAVHEGPGIKISINSLLQKRSSELRLVHRLDRGTSGVLIVGKGRSNTESLQNLFEQSTSNSSINSDSDSNVISSSALKKTYLALVAGTPKDRSGQIKSVMYKSRRAFGSGSALEPQMTIERSKRAELLDEGSVAITDYRMISSHMTEVSGVRVKLSLMEFIPRTGRTHQIRVHAAEHLGCPLVGDSRYGLTKIYNLSRIPGIGQGLHLHCKSIEFDSSAFSSVLTNTPAVSERIKFEAPLPKHFIKTINKFPIRIKPPRSGYEGK